jgi:hypothetical protein
MISRRDLVAGSFGTLRLAGLVSGLAMGLLGASLLASPAAAQRRGGFIFAASAHGGTARVGKPVARREAINRIAGLHARRGATGYGYFSNYYPYYDSPFEDGEAAGEPLPPRAPEQEARGAASAKAAVIATKPVESFVVEFRGDRWVRLTGYCA